VTLAAALYSRVCTRVTGVDDAVFVCEVVSNRFDRIRSQTNSDALAPVSSSSSSGGETDASPLDLRPTRTSGTSGRSAAARGSPAVGLARVATFCAAGRSVGRSVGRRVIDVGLFSRRPTDYIRFDRGHARISSTACCSTGPARMIPKETTTWRLGSAAAARIIDCGMRGFRAVAKNATVGARCPRAPFAPQDLGWGRGCDAQRAIRPRSVQGDTNCVQPMTSISTMRANSRLPSGVPGGSPWHPFRYFRCPCFARRITPNIAWLKRRISLTI